MAWALFSERFSFDRRPRQAVAFVVEPGVRRLPRDVVNAAIAAGKAEEIPAPARNSQTRPLVGLSQGSAAWLTQ